MDYIAKYRLQIIIALLLIFLLAISLIGFAIYKKSAASPSSQKANIAVNDTPFNGTYTGASTVGQGVSKSTVTVTDNSQIKGDATYSAPNDTEIQFSIYGTVQPNGDINGKLNGYGKLDGVSVSSTGSFYGEVVGESVNITYSISTPDMTIKNYTTLTKQ